MKTNHRVWPADSAACAGSELANLQHVVLQRRGPSRGKLERAAAQTEQEKKKEQAKLQLKTIEVVHPFKAILSGC